MNEALLALMSGMNIYRQTADTTGTLSQSSHAGSISAADLHRAIPVTEQQRFSRVMTTDEWIMEFLKACPMNALIN